ncbi:type III secretion system stator protein SctL [Phaeobacter sp. HF9A]|uniref:type III secretion system stator protein SctL n=1 Tax=Phaeobacter sp. HF9A TaxID=2721561 RepID=UPI00142F6E8F|nr:type III secretion system stator protein SctL [Phaeobacter sp. HF9A]NIZ12008.1 type III secretion system stator protein SctL [Phaeobacter sp. HF9A]
MSEVYRLNTLGVSLSAPDGVLRAETLTAIAGADALLKAAEAEAEAIRHAAQEVYDAEKARGFAEGTAEAERQAAGRMLAEQHRIDQQLAAMERDLGRLVHDCVTRIIERYSDEQLTRELARSALATMRSQRRGQLFVAPDMQEELRATLSGLLTEFPEIELVDVIADATLSAPNLRLETDLGVVSFVLQDTLEQLRSLLELQEG